MSYQITIGTENNISVTLAPMTYRVAIEQLAQSEIDSQVTAAQAARDLADTYASDAQSARDQSQTARDTAEDHKLAAEAAATSATNTASALTGFDLDAIATTKADTAVDVFVYDTSRDSDGGAWRKRTQHTSWYNETLNTSTRGSRREFPAVAVVVAEADKVTIYDGDDPSLPMWMVLGPSSGLESGLGIFRGLSVYPLRSVSAKNGVIATGQNSGFENRNNALSVFNFPKDTAEKRNNFAVSGSVPTLLSYRDTPVTGDLPNIVSSMINDVAMTILPDSPIDPATGLPRVTIAVATEGGVSVIKDDGTVVDSADTIKCDFIDIIGNNMWWGREFSANPIRRTSLLGISGGFGYDFYSRDSAPAISTNHTVTISASEKVIASGSDVNDPLLVLSTPDGDLSNGMVNYITSSYQSGWQNGDIKGAFLSDTDDTDLVGSGELVTNGTFDTDLTGWTDDNLHWAVSSGRAYHAPTSDFNTLRQSLSLEVGRTYALTFDYEVIQGTGRVQARTAANSADQDTEGLEGKVFTGTGTLTLFFTPSPDFDAFAFARNALGVTTEFYIDNASVKLADEDRSVNNNGLIVNGTVSRDPVSSGADLVAYSGFSASNYLEAPYNPDLDFGTGDFCVMGWVNLNNDTFATIFHKGLSNAAYGLKLETYTGTPAPPRAYVGVSAIVADEQFPVSGWFLATLLRRSGTVEIWSNDRIIKSTANSQNVENESGQKLRVGLRHVDDTQALGGSLALFRISATAPTAEQIAKIYEDEKVLFQENAQATLYGTSDAVTALAHDPVTDLLHVGTSAGRSVFQGLRRVENTTDAVTTAISAHNGLVIEQ